jgi:hypothetical protein
MHTTTESELPHESHFLFTAADHLYSSVRALNCQRDAAAKAKRINTVATQLMVCLADAIDIPTLRTRRLASAFGCTVRLNTLLRCLLLDGAIDPLDHQRLRAELSAIIRTLEKLDQLTAEPANETTPVEPAAVEPAPAVPPAEPRIPDVGPNSQSPPLDEPGSGSGSEVRTEAPNGGTDAAAAPEPPHEHGRLAAGSGDD